VPFGYRYYNGQGITEDSKEAARWYRKAAEQGYAIAQSSLGKMYENGTGMNKDYSKAVRWYRKAAEQNMANAQFFLALMYEDGKGLKKDYSKAVKWLRKAAKQGHAAAIFNLGMSYARGAGVKRNRVTAADWFYKAGVAFLKNGDRDLALASVKVIKKLGDVSNASLADKLLITIYDEDSTDTNQPRKKKSTLSFGTGWAISSSYVVTNNHVIAGHDKFVLLRTDGEDISATVAMRDVVNDLALLKVNDTSKMPKALRLAHMPARIGDKVFTIGYPHPTTMGTKPKLTDGIVSAVTGLKDDPRTYQISVPLQAGNSGGPLLNMDGEVVGVVTAKLSAVKVFKWTGDLPQNVN
jgi:S1-C subfamily serine protease